MTTSIRLQLTHRLSQKILIVTKSGRVGERETNSVLTKKRFVGDFLCKQRGGDLVINFFFNKLNWIVDYRYFIFCNVAIGILPQSIALVLFHVLGEISLLCDDFGAEWTLSSTTALSKMWAQCGNCKKENFIICCSWFCRMPYFSCISHRIDYTRIEVHRSLSWFLALSVPFQPNLQR